MRRYGLQLYSVRDTAEKDLLGAIEKVAAMGYQGMEFAGFFGRSAKDVKETLNACGVSAWGTHTGADALLPDVIDETIRYHHGILCERLIIPGHDLSTLQKLEEFARICEKAEKKLAAEGIQLAYHNHSHEFYTNEDGVIIYDWLLNNTNLKLELDTYWAFNAGRDPIALMETLGERVICIHLKDGIRGGEGKSLGLGEAPVCAVHDYALRHHVPMVVESEGLEPTGLEEVKRCIDYLKTLE